MSRFNMLMLALCCLIVIATFVALGMVSNAAIEAIRSETTWIIKAAECSAIAIGIVSGALRSQRLTTIMNVALVGPALAIILVAIEARDPGLPGIAIYRQLIPDVLDVLPSASLDRLLSAIYWSNFGGIAIGASVRMIVFGSPGNDHPSGLSHLFASFRK